jgi:hypothetical protein
MSYTMLSLYRSQVFLMPLGRTNTEFFTMNPVYGSNIHQNHGRKVDSPHQCSHQIQIVHRGSY